MLYHLLYLLCLASVAVSKNVTLQNKRNLDLTATITGKDNIVLYSYEDMTIELDDDWSGSITACWDECNGDVRSAAILQFGKTLDKYSVSLMKGFNLPIKVIPITDDKCDAAVCGVDLNKLCPAGNEVGNGVGHIVACENSPVVFESVCPKAVVSELDEKAKTLSCKAIAYRIMLG